MDQPTVTVLRPARSRADLRLTGSEAFVGGGTWLWSTPQPHLTGLVDLTALGWEPHTLTDKGLEVSSTCTVAELVRAAEQSLSAHPGLALVRPCAEALLMSFKVWNAATVGGNVCLGLPAGAMTALMAGLGATAVVWCPDGSERRVPVATFVTGVQQTTLQPGEVLRSLVIPTASLAASVAAEQISLAAMGRSAALVVGRCETEATTVTVTGATTRPVQLAFDAGIPTAAQARSALTAVDCWYADPHGPADWRAHVTGVLVERVVTRLAEQAR